MIFSCLCLKDGRRLHLFDRDGYDRALADIGDGEELEFSLESVGTQHTRAQEKFFHGAVLKAFMSLGQGKQEAKDMLALMFIPVDIHMLDGSVVRVPGHTSLLNREAYSQFIDACIQLAAEQGLVIEDVETWRARRQKETAA